MPPRDDTDSGPDIVLVILERVRRANPALTEEQAREIEQGVRDEYGGKRFRVAKRRKHPTQEQRKKVFREALTDASTEQITRENGISRRTLYYYLKKGGE